MIETAMSAIATAYLKERGYRVFAEVVFFGGSIDLVAIRPDLRFPVVIELKKSLTNHLIRQAYPKKVFTPFVWVVVGTRPRNVERVTRFGVGVATVQDFTVQVIAKPRFDRWHHDGRPSKLKYETGVEDGEGGIQSPAPAQVVIGRIRAYLCKNPRTTWADLFENVPNHYASVRSMYGALNAEIGVYMPFKRKKAPAGQMELL